MNDLNIPRTVNLTDLSLKESWKTVTNKNAVNNWVSFQLKDNTDLLIAYKQGNGLQSFIKHLKNNQSKILFGGFKVIAIDNTLGGLISKRDKYLYWSFVGSSIPELLRAQVNVLKRNIQNFFGSISLTLDLYGERLDYELTYNQISFKLYHGLSAHKPNIFDYGDDQVDCKTLEHNSDPDDSSSEDFD